MPAQDTTTSSSGLDVNEILSQLEVPFPPDQVQRRVTNTTNDKKRATSYPIDQGSGLTNKP